METNENKNSGDDYSKSNQGNYSSNGYQAMNRMNHQHSDDAVASAIEKAKQNAQKERARNSIRTGLNSVHPGVGEVADKMLNTEKGDELLDIYSNASTDAEGLAKVTYKIQNDTRKKLFIWSLIGMFVPILLVVVLLVTIFKNADTQIYSNENNGSVDTEQYPDDDSINPNIFIKYPGLYEKVEEATNKISNTYKLEIDKYLILATLIAPIENGLIMPVYDGSCGSDECYYFEGKSHTWEEFLDVWGSQSELLAKSQILTYVNLSSNMNVSCGSEDTMEQYAQNDFEITHFSFWNFLTWFGGFRDANSAELNAKCIFDVPPGESVIPTVRVLSKEQGVYYTSINAQGETTYEKDPNSGGVYFWNLVNKGGFIHVYLKDYLNIDENYTEEENYQLNLSTILDTANYIYAYYDSIRKDCNGYNIIESTIDKIKVKHKTDDGYDEIDMDQYIGGVILAEFNSGNDEAEKAFSILARSYAVAHVGVDGSGIIENSSNNQNYSYDYSPEKYPRIAEIVKATKGLVVTKYRSTKVLSTQYDAFCPVTNVLQNGFYYLPDGQRRLPINPSAYQAKTGSDLYIPDAYLTCPCYQNPSSRPVYPDDSVDPSCWRGSDMHYKPSGGHGNGASQYGLKYYGAFEYDWEALIRLFYGDVVIRKLESYVDVYECPYAEPMDESMIGSSTTDSCGVSFEVTDSNYTYDIVGTPLDRPLPELLEANGYDIDCLNSCIKQRVEAAGPGTRAGVVEASVGLLECTMQMTGGYTIPYDHTAGKVEVGLNSVNADVYGKLGVNSKWGVPGGLCVNEPCRLGLNCATSVRWAFCNGGFDLCTTGSAGAVTMTSTRFFPEQISITIQGNQITIRGDNGMYSGMSGAELVQLAQPGDTIFSENMDGSGDHAMLIVGKDDLGLWISENGRKTRRILYQDFFYYRKIYRINLLDGYYANPSHLNSLY